MPSYLPITANRKALDHTLVRDSWWRQLNLKAYTFLLPFFALFILFRVYPFLVGIYTSFTNARIGRASETFVGLANYTRALNSFEVRQAFANTVSYAIVVVPLTFFLSLAMAVYINRKLPGHHFARLVFFAPYVLSVSVVAIIWGWMFNAQFGLVNWSLGMFGLPNRTPWLADMTLVLPSIAFITAWWTAGFSMVIFLGALQDIPHELIESARIDGASSWQTFWRVTFPLLGHASSLVLTLSTIEAFRVFSLMYIITQGGPAGASTSVVLLIFREGFTYFNLGYAAAIGMLLFFVILAVTVIRTILFRGDIGYRH
ncbi:sugar ABC transporter permease [Aggregatilineales bacterium SYSU G02658]